MRIILAKSLHFSLIAMKRWKFQDRCNEIDVSDESDESDENDEITKEKYERKNWNFTFLILQCKKNVKFQFFHSYFISGDPQWVISSLILSH